MKSVTEYKESLVRSFELALVESVLTGEEEMRSSFSSVDVSMKII